MKKLKFAVSVMLVFILTFPLIFVNTYAKNTTAENTDKSYTSLEEIAEDYIMKTSLTDEEGVTTTIITKIPEFVKAVHKYMPHVEDIAIAKFLYKYTEKNDNTESLPDEIVLEILTSEEVGVQTEVLFPEGSEARNALFADDGNVEKYVLMSVILILLIAIAVLAILFTKKKTK